jgi:hypothetical protein
MRPDAAHLEEDALGAPDIEQEVVYQRNASARLV